MLAHRTGTRLVEGKDTEMARTRRASNPAAKPAAQTNGSGEFTCPECGKTFTRAASLGAHRQRAHGIPGAAAKARTSAGKRSRRTSRPAATRRAASSDGARAQVNRDALLQALFPNGVPAREAVIRAANDWLNQAEQLAKMK
jgi:uncharacterized C2H2 Zn-finger protein